MPKGVEHNRSEQWKTIAMCVESLMPKGVEHKGNRVPKAIAK